MAKRNALGRGLGALIDDVEVKKGADPVLEIDIDLIELNPFQPRQTFDDEALKELSASISKLGIIQPLTIRELDGKYQLITGERRLRASKMAGLKTIPAYVRKADDQAMLEMALVENIQREDLDPIEIAISYQRLIDEINLTQESLSERVGKKRSTVSNYLRLLKLPAEIQLGLRARKLSMGHARTLVNIDNEDLQLEIFKKILENELSVRKIEEMVRDLKKSPEEKKASENKEQENVKEYRKLQSHLKEHFNSEVQLVRNNKGKGRIVIPFKNDEDLERIIGIFDRLNS